MATDDRPMTPRTPNPNSVRRIVAYLWGRDIEDIRAAIESFGNGYTVVPKSEAAAFDPETFMDGARASRANAAEIAAAPAATEALRAALQRIADGLEDEQGMRATAIAALASPEPTPDEES